MILLGNFVTWMSRFVNSSTFLIQRFQHFLFFQKNAFCNVFYTWDQRFLHLGISQQFSKIQTTCDHKSHMHKYMCILVYGSLSTCKCDSLGTHCMLLNTHYKLLDGICIYIDFQHRRSYTVSYFFI